MSEKKKKRIVRNPNRDANYLPEHVCQGFEKDLDSLIANLDPTIFKNRYLQAEYKSKYYSPEGLSADERLTAAVLKWKATEEVNAITNQRLMFAHDVDFGWVTYEAFNRFVRDLIYRVLGPLDLDALFARGGNHTNGASTRVSRGITAALQKHSGEAHCTPLAIKHWIRYAQGTKLSAQTIRVVDGSVMFTVPKNSEIDRPACKEPEINMFLQRNAGGYIRSRLKRFGVNLNDQTVNQVYAREALVKGLATIDLSAASDSITKQLVMELLPTDWWSYLDDLRSHQIDVYGDKVETELFSSMGNGFTFELESLIFWALTRAVCYFSGVKGAISVYGDDIICPKQVGPRLKRVFSFLGFTVNAKKSFWSGPFRESCGSHYYNSLEVTPFFVREPVGCKTDVIRLLNRLLKWDNTLGYFCTPEVEHFHRRWSQQIPSSLHGGYDVDSSYALVTPGPLRKKLVQRVRDVRSFAQNEALTWWLTETSAVFGDSDPYRQLEVRPSLNGRFVLADNSIPVTLLRPFWPVYQYTCLEKLV